MSYRGKVAYVVADEQIDLMRVDLPNYIMAKTGPASNCAVTLNTQGSKMQDGIDAVLAVYPDAQVTALHSIAFQWATADD